MALGPGKRLSRMRWRGRRWHAGSPSATEVPRAAIHACPLADGALGAPCGPRLYMGLLLTSLGEVVVGAAAKNGGFGVTQFAAVLAQRR